MLLKTILTVQAKSSNDFFESHDGGALEMLCLELQLCVFFFTQCLMRFSTVDVVDAGLQ